MHKGHYAEDTVEGTGSEITVECGFQPDYVRIVNEDGLAVLEWFADMTDAHGIKQVTAGTISKITSGGITPYAGSSGSEGAGFKIGTDTDINVSAETLHYIAISKDS